MKSLDKATDMPKQKLENETCFQKPRPTTRTGFSPPRVRRGFLPKTVVMLFIYLVQGLPFGFQDKYLPVYYRSLGIDYSSISYFRIIYLPWLLKIIWAPFVDMVQNKQKFIKICLALLICCNILAYFVPLENLAEFACVMLLFNLITAIEDVAVDSYALETLSKEELGFGNTAQVVGYKLGVILGSGGVSFVASRFGSSVIFIVMAFIQFLVMYSFVRYTSFEQSALKSTDYQLTYSSRLDLEPLPRSSTKAKIPVPVSEANDTRIDRRKTVREASDSQIHSTRSRIISTKNVDGNLKTPAESFQSSRQKSRKKNNYIDVLKIPGTHWISTFVVVYKLGEIGALALFPLFLIDAGLNASRVHMLHGIVGQIASVFGSLLGGWKGTRIKFIGNYLITSCVVRLLIIFGIRQIIVHAKLPLDETESSFMIMTSYILLTVLNIVSGFITTLTFTLMMYVSKKAPPEYQGFHYSCLATAEVLGKIIMSVAMGPVVDWFGVEFAITVCVMMNVVLIPLLASYKKVYKN